MAKRLTKKQVIARAQAELDKAWAAYNEILEAGSGAGGRTTRQRAAIGRADRWLRRREVPKSEREAIMMTAPPEPVYGKCNITLRLPSDLARELTDEANRLDMSRNALIVSTLEKMHAKMAQEENEHV